MTAVPLSSPAQQRRWRAAGKAPSGSVCAVLKYAERCSACAARATAAKSIARAIVGRRRVARRKRAANGRHQRSPEGRADHRDRRREFRRRLVVRVTDEDGDGPSSLPTSAAASMKRRTN